ncbi:MAG: TonB-dependent receptor [Fretibacterium sp.]|nr:TonB-dependent receptor [Fretibacterium sp.]
MTTLPEEAVVATAMEEDKLLLSPGSVTVVRPQEMKGEQKDLPELLKQVPGLHVVETKGRGAYTVASIRGSSAAQVAVYVDGVLMNLGSEAAVDLSTIPVENVERIEVYRGYIPSRFGGASMGGVINIVSKRPEGAGGSLSFGAHSFGGIRSGLAWSAPLGGGDIFLGANFDHSDGDFKYPNDNNTPYTPSDDYEARRQNNRYERSDVLLKWHDAHWRVEGSWKRNDRVLPYSAPGADKPESPRGADFRIDQWSLVLARRQSWGDLEWGFRVEYLEQAKKYDDPANTIGGWGEQHNRYDTERLSFALDGAIPIGERHLLEFLWNWYDESLNTDGDVVKKMQGIPRHDRRSWNVQVQDTISLGDGDNLWLTPVIRWNGADGRTEFSWGAALAWRFSEGWSLKLTGGTYNRAPNLYELYGDGAFIIPNPALKWESGTQWDVGLAWKGGLWGGQAAAELTVFGRHSDDLIDYLMTNPRFAQYVNIGKAEVIGAELEANMEWENWALYLAATWMDPKNKTPGYMDGDPLANRPEWEGTLRATRRWEKFSAFAELHYVGKNYYDMQGKVGWTDLLTTGLGIRWQPRENLKLVLGVDDVFDAGPDLKLFAVGSGPERTLWYPIQGRTFYMSLIWNF